MTEILDVHIDKVMDGQNVKLEISGKTYKHRNFFKDHKGQWDLNRKLWILDGDKYSKVVEYLERREELKREEDEEKREERQLLKSKRYLCKGNGCWCLPRSRKLCRLCSQACCSETKYDSSIDPYWAHCDKHLTQYWMCND